MVRILAGLLIGVAVVGVAYVWWALIERLKRKPKRRLCNKVSASTLGCQATFSRRSTGGAADNRTSRRALRAYTDSLRPGSPPGSRRRRRSDERAPNPCHGSIA
jgi:hypothetical protein